MNYDVKKVDAFGSGTETISLSEIENILFQARVYSAGAEDMCMLIAGTWLGGGEPQRIYEMYILEKIKDTKIGARIAKIMELPPEYPREWKDYKKKLGFTVAFERAYKSDLNRNGYYKVKWDEYSRWEKQEFVAAAYQAWMTAMLTIKF
jgi:hypothetical protein